MFLAVDPGTDKCGLAIVERDGTVLRHAVVATGEVSGAAAAWRRDFPRVERVLLGGGTGHERVRAMLVADASAPVEVVPERNTTFRARERYFRENPPPWFLRWIPLSMRVPPAPVDDWAAVIIAEDYIASGKS